MINNPIKIILIVLVAFISVGLAFFINSFLFFLKEYLILVIFDVIVIFLAVKLIKKVIK